MLCTAAPPPRLTVRKWRPALNSPEKTWRHPGPAVSEGSAQSTDFLHASAVKRIPPPVTPKTDTL